MADEQIPMSGVSAMPTQGINSQIPLEGYPEVALLSKPFGMVDVAKDQAEMANDQAVRAQDTNILHSEEDKAADTAITTAWTKADPANKLVTPDDFKKYMATDTFNQLSLAGQANIAKAHGDKLEASAKLDKMLNESTTEKLTLDAKRHQAAIDYIIHPTEEAYQTEYASQKALGKTDDEAKQMAEHAMRDRLKQAAEQVKAFGNGTDGKPLVPPPADPKALDAMTHDEFSHLSDFSKDHAQTVAAKLKQKKEEAEIAEKMALTKSKLADKSKEVTIQGADGKPHIGLVDLETNKVTDTGQEAPPTAASAAAGNKQGFGALDPSDKKITYDAISSNEEKLIDAFPGRSVSASKDRATAMAEIKKRNPHWSEQSYDLIKKFEGDKRGDSVRFTGVALEHQEELSQLAKALKNEDLPLVNKIYNSLAPEFGATAPGNFDSISQFVGDETVKSVLGSAGGVTDRHESQKMFENKKTPAQMSEVLGNIQGLIGSQLAGLKRQYLGMGGTEEKFNSYLSPAQIELLDKNKKTYSPKEHKSTLPPVSERVIDKTTYQINGKTFIWGEGGKWFPVD